MDRGAQGLKRFTLTDAHGIPLNLVSAGANRHDAPLLAPTLAGLDALPDDAAVHLDRGSITAVIVQRGVPAPLPVGDRWVIERTHSWMNGFGKLRRCTERSGIVVDFSLFLATAVITRRPHQQSAHPLSGGQSPGDPQTHMTPFTAL